MRSALVLGLAVGLAGPVSAQTTAVTVSAPTRLDWAFAVRGFGKEAGVLPAGYSSTAQKYQLFVPRGYSDKQAWPLVVFLSASNQSAGWPAWKKTCEKEGVFFCSPLTAGNNVAAMPRARIILDAVDDVRRKYRIDPDQTYLSGFSGGGRMACAIGFSLPEIFAGVVPVCGTNPLSPPDYLRHRLVDRVSVAFVTGERDFNRKENEVYMAPYFEQLGIRSKLWVAQGVAHGIPGPEVMAQVYSWLKEDLSRRRSDARDRPDLTLADGSADEQGKRLLAAAQKEFGDKTRIWHGVTLLQGITYRWPKTDAGRAASAILKKLLSDERLLDAIGELGARDEQKSLGAQAKALERFGNVPGAIEAWQILATNYAGTPVGEEAEAQVRRLRGKAK